MARPDPPEEEVSRLPRSCNGKRDTKNPCAAGTSLICLTCLSLKEKNKIKGKRWQGCLFFLWSSQQRDLALESVASETTRYSIDITRFFLVSHSSQSVASVTLSGSALALVTG